MATAYLLDLGIGILGMLFVSSFCSILEFLNQESGCRASG